MRNDPDSHAQRKAKVYEAALALTSQGVSPAAMTIQQLADAAGIGKGTVYEYFFPRKKRFCRAWPAHPFCSRRTSASLPGLTAAARWSILENELVDYLQEVAAQRMSTYRLLASSFGQQAALPECTNACRSQLTALTDALVARLQAAGEIDPGLTMDACRTSIFCTVTGGLIALCCSAGSGASPCPPCQKFAGGTA